MSDQNKENMATAMLSNPNIPPEMRRKAQSDLGINTVGVPEDVSFVDPTGMFTSTYDQLAAQTSDPDAWMRQFMGQSEGLANLVSGQMSPLQQSLNALATRQAALGGEAALAAMPGSRNSGAGMAAFGQAYADPFANVQAQIAGKQLDLTGNMWNTAMQGYNTQYNNALSLQSALAGKTGDLWSPTYMSKDKTSASDVMGTATSAATLAKILGFI